MYVLIIAISCTISIIFLSKANIKITVKHEYPSTPTPIQPTEPIELDKKLEDMYTKEQLPSFDDVLKLAQNLIGGDTDAETDTTTK